MKLKQRNQNFKKKLTFVWGWGCQRYLSKKVYVKKVILFAIKRQLIYYLNDKIITRLSLLNVKTKCFNFRQDDSQVF